MWKGPGVVHSREGEESIEEDSDIRYGRKGGSGNRWWLAPTQRQQVSPVWGFGVLRRRLSNANGSFMKQQGCSLAALERGPSPARQLCSTYSAVQPGFTLVCSACSAPVRSVGLSALVRVQQC